MHHRQLGQTAYLQRRLRIQSLSLPPLSLSFSPSLHLSLSLGSLHRTWLFKEMLFRGLIETRPIKDAHEVCQRDLPHHDDKSNTAASVRESEGKYGVVLNPSSWSNRVWESALLFYKHDLHLQTISGANRDICHLTNNKTYWTVAFYILKHF